MTVLKFGAVWCSACLIMKPRWAEIEQDNPWLTTKYFEYDDDLKEVKEYNINKDIPVFVFLDDKGSELLRLSGEISKKEIQQVLDKYKDK
jgi:thiol-disulfide isomerase/thioredoxin